MKTIKANFNFFFFLLGITLSRNYEVIPSISLRLADPT